MGVRLQFFSALRAGPAFMGSLWIAALLCPILLGCSTTQLPGLEARREQVEAALVAQGVAKRPAVDAARSELEASLAREEAEVAIDGIELRGSWVHERDDKAQLLARLPLRNPLELREQKNVRRAESRIALARLEEVGLAQRVAGCLPSLQILARKRHDAIYDAYATRHRALLEWNRELREAGLIDEVGSARVELEGNVKLGTRDPSRLATPRPLRNVPLLVDVLPEPLEGLPPLRVDSPTLHQTTARHHPTLRVHQARRERFESLAQREEAKRRPWVRFVDFGFEPVAFPMDDRQVSARVAVEIPFGREAGARARGFQAQARAERSRERATLDNSGHEAAIALSEINAFRASTGHWLALVALADESEEVADRWWQGRLADPGQISNLLDSVYVARLAVLEARRRAGRAGCRVVEATGLTVGEWPE